MEAMLDMKTWLLFLFALTSNSPNGELTSVRDKWNSNSRNKVDNKNQFQGLIIKVMGFSTLETTLVQMPSGAVQMMICPFAW